MKVDAFLGIAAGEELLETAFIYLSMSADDADIHFHIS